MKKIFLSATALVVLFAACSKDDNKPDPVNTPQIPKVLLNQVTPHDSLVAVYDSAYHLIKTSVWDEDGSFNGTDELVYENGKATKIMNGNADGTSKLWQTMEYNSAGQLLKVAHYYSGENASSYDSLAYGTDGRPVASYKTSFNGSVYQLSDKTVYTWDSKGNLAKEIHLSYSNGNHELPDTGIVNYTYDDKPNWGNKQPEFFLLQPDDVSFTLSANNIVKSVSTNSGIANAEFIMDKTYTYDADGYPATRKDLVRSIQNGEVKSSYEDSFRFTYNK